MNSNFWPRNNSPHVISRYPMPRVGSVHGRGICGMLTISWHRDKGNIPRYHLCESTRGLVIYLLLSWNSFEMVNNPQSFEVPWRPRHRNNVSTVAMYTTADSSNKIKVSLNNQACYRQISPSHQHESIVMPSAYFQFQCGPITLCVDWNNILCKIISCC